MDGRGHIGRNRMWLHFTGSPRNKVCQRRRRLVRRIASAGFMLLTMAGWVHADIYQWEWVDANDPSQGIRQSTVLCPDGAGVSAVPLAALWYRDLTRAYLVGADLHAARF